MIIDVLTALPHELVNMDLLMMLPQDGDVGGSINMLVERFNEGNSEGPWMWPVLICLIIGLGIAFERIISLNRADINTPKFIVRAKRALEEGGVPAAEEVCAKTRGPVASVFQAGLMRVDEGLDAVEKAVVSGGSIEMSKLERGLVWLSLFISVAPMLGFLGTVIGMIEAFDAIEQAGDISPQLVAGGIKVALLTTAFGLIVAVILQFFHNYAVSKIDRLVKEMEDASIELIDTLALMNRGDGRSPLPSSTPSSGTTTAGTATAGTKAAGKSPTAKGTSPGEEPGDNVTGTKV